MTGVDYPPPHDAGFRLDMITGNEPPLKTADEVLQELEAERDYWKSRCLDAERVSLLHYERSIRLQKRIQAARDALDPSTSTSGEKP